MENIFEKAINDYRQETGREAENGQMAFLSWLIMKQNQQNKIIEDLLTQVLSELKNKSSQ